MSIMTDFDYEVLALELGDRAAFRLFVSSTYSYMDWVKALKIAARRKGLIT